MKQRYSLLILLFIFLPIVAYAECSNSDKVKYDALVNKVKVNYDITIEDDLNTIISQVDDEVIYAKNRVLNITIENLSEGMVVTMRSEKNNHNELFSYDRNNQGKISTKIYDLNFLSQNKVNTYTFNISLSTDSCQINNLKTLYLTTPKYNVNSSYIICDGLLDKLYYCNRYVTSDFDEDTFFNKVNEYKDEQQKDKTTKEQKQANNFKYILIGIISLVVIILVITIIVIRKRMKRKKK